MVRWVHAARREDRIPGAVKDTSFGGGAGTGAEMGYIGMMVFHVFRSIGTSASQSTSTGSSAKV